MTIVRKPTGVSMTTTSTQEKELTIMRESRDDFKESYKTTLRQPPIASTIYCVLAVVVLTLTSWTNTSSALVYGHGSEGLIEEEAPTAVSDDLLYSSPEDAIAELIEKPARLASIVPVALGIKLFWQNRRHRNITTNILTIALPVTTIVILLWQLAWLFGLMKLLSQIIELLVRLIIYLILVAIDTV